LKAAYLSLCVLRVSAVKSSLLALLLLAGCASPPEGGFAGPRSFVFQRDTLQFANETVWRYDIDPDTGKTTTVQREPPPEYSHRCFRMSYAARQFFRHAEFNANFAPVSDEHYQRLIRAVLTRGGRAGGTRIVLPGYEDLHSFSAAKGELLKRECGGAWRSYLQRGNWRMVLPFTRGQQERMAQRLAEKLPAGPTVVHVFRFPQLTINHALVLYGVREEAGALRFTAYDPNLPETPVEVAFDRGNRAFSLPPSFYFAGGRVNLYEIYTGWCY
jgi:hypothetical protein